MGGWVWEAARVCVSQVQRTLWLAGRQPPSMVQHALKVETAHPRPQTPGNPSSAHPGEEGAFDVTI